MGAVDHRRSTQVAVTDTPPEELPARRKCIVTAVTGLGDIISATCPELHWSGTWEPRHAYGGGVRPERRHDELYVWRASRGCRIVHVVDRRAAVDAAAMSEIHLEARLEIGPDGDENGSRLVGTGRLGEDLGDFLEALLMWTRLPAERQRNVEVGHRGPEPASASRVRAAR